MKPLLAINIGNTNIQIGIFQDSARVASWRAFSEVDKSADEYSVLFHDFFAHPNPVPLPIPGKDWGAIVASVVPPLTPTIIQLCRDHFQLDPLVVHPGLDLGMPIRYDNPRALGVDRLVGAVGAKAKYGAPVIVVDFGTATTFNAVNRTGEFAGGAIAPGVNLTAAALAQGTAQLPRIDLAAPPNALATNTVQAIQSGVLFGYVALVEGMISRLRAELGEPKARIVATGGQAPLIAPHVPGIAAVEPNLILEGLQFIFQKQKGSRQSSDYDSNP